MNRSSTASRNHGPLPPTGNQVSSNTATDQTLIIEGTGCASCVGKIEKALMAVPGVQTAEMNFANRTVQVQGRAATELLVKAVEQAGYNARPMAGESLSDALDEKEQADLA